MPLNAQAAECAKGELMLEYMVVNTLMVEPFYTARLSGLLDMPTPNYTYDLQMAKEGEQTTGQLVFREKEPGMIAIQMITPITIDDTIKIPHESQSLMLNVTKTFGWGAEYFQAKFPEGFENHKPICMKPEMYK